MLPLESLLSLEIQRVVSDLELNSGPEARLKACMAFESSQTMVMDYRFRLRNSSEIPIQGPKAKHGEPMHLLGQFDFTSIAAIGSHLHLYLSPGYRDYQPKERGWNLLTIQSPAQETAGGWINLEPKLALDPDSDPKLAAFELQQTKVLFQRVKLGEVLNIAAFHANGISYSQARAKDPHYGHLRESARNWFVLFAIREKDILDQASSRILYVCMTEDDFDNKAFGKCQLVFV